MKTGIIGGGPAGAETARLLAEKGGDVILFEEKDEWEKPCGGGITPRAFLICPHLKRNELTRREIDRTTFIAPSGRKAAISLKDPLAIVSRKALFNFQLDEAKRKGAKLIREKIKDIKKKGKGWLLLGEKEDYEVDFLIGADGIKSVVRRRLSRRFQPEELGFALVLFPEGEFPPEIIIRFFSSPSGYAWWFPRIDHASAGICTSLEEQGRENLKELLLRFIEQESPLKRENKGRAVPYLISFLRLKPLPKLYGENWALIGDAAGLADPLTGEGIYPALLSAHLISRAIEEENIQNYGKYLKKQLFPEIKIASRLRKILFAPKFLELLISLLAESEATAKITGELLSGKLSYSMLNRKVLSTLPKAAKDLIYLTLSRK
jgi:geranylgeranyl reductase family protein